MTLEELRAMVREITDTGLAELVPDSQLDRLLGAVLAEVWHLEPWPFATKLASLVLAADGTVALPADARRVDTVRLTSAPDAPVLVRRHEEPADWFDAAGEPVEFYVEPTTGTLTCWPTGTGTVRVRYTSAPAALTAGAQVPGLPAEFHRLLGYGAAARLLAEQGDEGGQEAAFQREYESGLSQMRTVLLAPVNRPLVMGSRRAPRGRRWPR